MSTQPLYRTSTFGVSGQDHSSSTPIRTQVGHVPSPSSNALGTGQAPSTHQLNMSYQHDSRVDIRMAGTNLSGNLTGPGYDTVRVGQEPAPPYSDNNNTYGTSNPPSDATGRGYGASTESHATGSKLARKGEELGHSAISLFAEVHGAGELLRGGLMAALDKAFGDEKGAAKNAEIASKGEQEMRSGQFR
ncbi:hypothetical protein EYZ11_001233 [Aspergillus tanneri]|uniref:Uncharacterized protein n=1 Tax=Aspergillus tanneri TaxID=1220188 RepID=A0A4S3JVA3_9EURO|nr:uncharacterized protein ATNIH1004_011033 [Aspergillus tanneri]KAA8642092.1 hypothetical protein ATNIH1004_011033 [Aspergillus tanneri]THC99327.1 hypothetical protein EYZ11_001233 [Aspergillus tanneri]